jgi:phosphotransferase system HPr (HPr) family protein
MLYPEYMHGMPSSELVKTARRFRSHIGVSSSAEGPWSDGKSIPDVMELKHPEGKPLYIRAEGDDADTAIAALVETVERFFSL